MHQHQRRPAAITRAFVISNTPSAPRPRRVSIYLISFVYFLLRASEAALARGESTFSVKKEDENLQGLRRVSQDLGARTLRGRRGEACFIFRILIISLSIHLRCRDAREAMVSFSRSKIIERTATSRPYTTYLVILGRASQFQRNNIRGIPPLPTHKQTYFHYLSVSREFVKRRRSGGTRPASSISDKLSLDGQKARAGTSLTIPATNLRRTYYVTAAPGSKKS